MGKLWKIAAVLLLFLFVASHAAAQTDADIEAHRAAAQGFLHAMQAEKTYNENLVNMVDLQIKQNPMLESFGTVMTNFFDRYLSYASLEDFMVELYMAEFTTAELNELTAFYNTPLGRKLALTMPRLTNKGAEIGMQRVKEHQGELQNMLQEEAQRQMQEDDDGQTIPE